ncbi:MAG: TIGR00300 family protein [Phycisphaerae bacterium]|nr:TIGR00300 family protein [Phycisphaerae bacterium]
MPVETVVLDGHIIDSLTLPKVLDAVVEYGGAFKIEKMEVGATREDPSHVQIRVTMQQQERMDQLLERLRDLGAHPVDEKDAELAPVVKDGAFPENFYATTNLTTNIRLAGRWIEVERPEMDKGIAVDPAARRAWTVPMAKARKGQLLVVGMSGVRVMPVERPETHQGFSFMTSAVSTEKPKLVQTRAVADLMRAAKKAGRRILLVGGPAIIHTGSGAYLVRLIEAGYVDVLFAGNALAAHDVEQAIFGTSLGVNLAEGTLARHGHQHHLRAINLVRLAGGLAKAIEAGLITSGVMHACIKRNIPFVLAGSIRDDGPLPEVITDTAAAQDAMRAQIPGLGLALMIGTTLHSVATGNMLPASVTTVAVDINANVVTKLLDRGSWQTIGIVTDTEPFLRELASELCESPKPLTVGQGSNR